MAVVTKSKKQADQITDESGLFYVDERARKSQERPHQRILERMPQVKNTYEAVTGEKISTYEDFREMVESPEAFWRKNKAEHSVATKNAAVLQLVEAGFDLSLLEPALKLPEGFDAVVRDCQSLQRETFSWTNYAFDGTAFVFSEKLVNFFLNKIYYYAPEPLQKKRLELANKFLALLPEWEELVRQECAEAGVPSAKVEKMLAAHKWIGPLPFCLKFEKPMSPYFGLGDNEPNRVNVNEQWVVTGSKIYSDQIGLPQLKPAMATRKWVNNTRYKRFWKVDMDGLRRPYYTQVGQEKAAFLGMGREGNVIFDNGEFQIVDGRFVPVQE